jgi:hypothetical protein
VAHTSKWEPIGAALEPIVSGGLPNEKAKLALCREISDRNIRILQHLAEEAELPAKTHEGLLNEARVFPADIDWGRSRPSRRCPAFANSRLIVHPNSLLAVVYDVKNLISRKVYLLEVCIDDVMTVFGTSGIAAEFNTETATDNRSPTAATKTNKGAKSRGIGLAIDALWPNGIPDGLATADQIPAICVWLTDEKLSIPNVRTIQRVLQKRRLEAAKA